MDAKGLVDKGQKDGSVMFRCAVSSTGEIQKTWTYRGTPESELLAQELLKCLTQTVFIPAIFNHQPVSAFFYGTVVFSIAEGKPRLRIFANQETAEVAKENNFVSPQPFVGPGSNFAGMHYPDESKVPVAVEATVDLALKIDAEGNLKEMNVVGEDPPLLGFGRAAEDDFGKARFIPAFRDGKPVSCSITLPVYYEP
jgi:hypothetical protein